MTVAVTSPGWAIAADAASFLVSIVFLARLRFGPRATRAPTSFVRELREGWDEFWARTWLWVIVVQFSLCNVFIAAPFFVLGAVVAKESLGGAGAWGAVLACQGGGAVLGGIAMLRYRPARPLLVATAVTYAWVLPLCALAFSLPLPLVVAGAVLGGFSLSTFGALWETTLQRNVPSQVLSRVSAYDWLGSLVLLPLGEAAVGPLARVIGSRATLVGAAALIVFAVTVVLLVPAVTGLRAAADPGARPRPGSTSGQPDARHNPSCNLNSRTRAECGSHGQGDPGRYHFTRAPTNHLPPRTASPPISSASFSAVRYRL